MQTATCAVHAQREAIGICVACHRRVCAECSTKVDGINYCVRCLAELARAEATTRERETSADSWVRVVMGSLVAGFGLWLSCRTLLQLLFPESQ